MLRDYCKKTVPGIDKLKLICEAIPCSADWLLFGTGPEQRDSSSVHKSTAEYIAEKLKGGDAKTEGADGGLDPRIESLLQAVKRILVSGNQMAYDALENNIRYFDHAVAAEQRLCALEEEQKRIRELLSKKAM